MSDYLTGPLNVFVDPPFQRILGPGSFVQANPLSRGYDRGSWVQGTLPRLTFDPLLTHPQQPQFKRTIIATILDVWLMTRDIRREYVPSPALATIGGPARPTEGQIWPR